MCSWGLCNATGRLDPMLRLSRGVQPSVRLSSQCLHTPRVRTLSRHTVAWHSSAQQFYKGCTCAVAVGRFSFFSAQVINVVRPAVGAVGHFPQTVGENTS